MVQLHISEKMNDAVFWDKAMKCRTVYDFYYAFGTDIGALTKDQVGWFEELLVLARTAEIQGAALVARGRA